MTELNTKPSNAPTGHGVAAAFAAIVLGILVLSGIDALGSSGNGANGTSDTSTSVSPGQGSAELACSSWEHSGVVDDLILGMAKDADDVDPSAWGTLYLDMSVDYSDGYNTGPANDAVGLDCASV